LNGAATEEKAPKPAVIVEHVMSPAVALFAALAVDAASTVAPAVKLIQPSLNSSQ
jgi:hypothetical protein